MLIKITRTIDSLEHYIPKGRVYMKSVKNINYKVITIMIIIIIPILLIAQYYLFKFGAITPMVKGIEIEMEDGDYVKDIDKFVILLINFGLRFSFNVFFAISTFFFSINCL